ncbi:DUF2381 family protein [Archangium lansingense]|uniref:DUF2381 family protein n=1 Tax=Archangium lansingense TaxID=2995310 RepID=UPI003B81207A
MLPTLCGHLALLAALSGEPPDLPPPQVTSPQPHPTQEAIPEVTSAPSHQEPATTGSAPPFRFIPPLDPAAFGQRSGETGTPIVTPGPGGARPEDSRARFEPGLLARLVLSGRLDWSGVTVTWLLEDSAPSQQGEVFAERKTLYRARTLAVVTLALRLSPAATRPWAPGEAWLLDAQGGVVGRFPVWMEGTRLGPGETRTVAIEVELVPRVEPGTLRLELREQDGGRTVHAGDLKP